jgi:hypothetical protein
MAAGLNQSKPGVVHIRQCQLANAFKIQFFKQVYYDGDKFAASRLLAQSKLKWRMTDADITPKQPPSAKPSYLFNIIRIVFTVYVVRPEQIPTR